MREKIFGWINWISRHWLQALLAVATVLLVASAALRLIFPPPPIEIVNFVPTDKLLPDSTILITFDGNPANYDCRAATESNDRLVTRFLGSDTMEVAPTSFWSFGAIINLNITCERYSQVLNFIVASAEDLSQEQSERLQWRLDLEFGKTLEKFNQDNPFAQSFPIKRTDYTLYFHDDINKIVIGSNRVFSPSEKQRIIAEEKPKMAALGVPEEIEIVFAADLP